MLWTVAREHGDYNATELLLTFIRRLPDNNARRAAQRHLLPALRGAGGAALLDELLRDVSVTDIDWVLTALLTGTPNLDGPSLVVLRSIASTHAAQTLKWAHSSEWSSRCAAAVVAGAFSMSEQGLKEVLAIDWLTPIQHGLLVLTFTEVLADDFIPHWVADYAGTDVRFWSVLLRYGVHNPKAIDLLARISERAQQIPLARVATAAEDLSALDGSTHSTDVLRDHVMRQVMSDSVGGYLDTTLTTEWYSKPWVVSWFQTLRATVLRNILGDLVRASSDGWGRAWLFLSNAPDALYANAQRSIEAGVETLTRVQQITYTGEVVSSWICILKRLEPHDIDERYIAAAGTALQLGLSRSEEALSRLVAVAFYPVHQAAMQDSPTSSNT